MIGWLNAWEWMPWWKGFGPTAANNWSGALSIPVTVKLCDDEHLKFCPVKELEVLRGNHFQLKNTKIMPNVRALPERASGESLEIIAEFKLKGCEAQELGFNLRSSINGSEKTVILYNVKEKKLHFDRSKSDSSSEGVRTCNLKSIGSKNLKLHIFVDTSCIEIFANEGRIYMSNNIYPHPGSNGIDLFSRGGKVKLLSLDIWKLKSIW